MARGDVVTLDGSGSSAAIDLTYAWTLTAPGGSAATLAAADSAGPSFTADRDGSYVATLVVAAGGLTSDEDSVTITAQDMAPTVSAGPDRATDTGVAVTMLGVASDPNDDPITYEWTIVSAPPGSEAALDDPTIVMPTLVTDEDGEYRLQVVASDGTLESSPDEARVVSYHPLAGLD